jgi:hypothetical protein
MPVYYTCLLCVCFVSVYPKENLRRQWRLESENGRDKVRG